MWAMKPQICKGAWAHTDRNPGWIKRKAGSEDSVPATVTLTEVQSGLALRVHCAFAFPPFLEVPLHWEQ